MPARADTVRQSSVTDCNCNHRGGVGREEEPEDSGSSFRLARWLIENREEERAGEGGSYSGAAASLRAEDATPGGSKARLFGGGTVDPTRGRGGWRQILEGLS